MDERTKAAFESVRDNAKQFMALSTGVVALTVTFAKDFLTAAATHRPLVYVAWYALLLSAFFGCWVLLAVTGTLGRSNGDLDHTKIYGANIGVPAFLQVVAFVVGLGAAITFGTLQP